ncbi:winged helix-turn-helix domain-containing protein [Lacrimispora sp. NSJ-141]|uniref:Winged helix-turn-helix domain-containing protein n=1 Tax=Lientehia hominis TaxID=2897778 RepID=A0AAP2RHY5_9FIRM|nr:primase-like DNA-binding domain-containing protein [Lientehia hominis]MCD2492467.1 winged helix-turn-helix domain-containing protein [Lientehia hominis]
MSEPAVCVEALDDYRVDNDPVRQFVDTVMSSLVWNLVPWQFLYDLYGAWMSRNNPNGRAENLRTFKRRITELLPTLPEWSDTGENAMRTGDKMNDPGPLIVEYDLKNWRNQSYRGMDVNKIATPETKARYRGLVRVSGGSVAAG